MRPSSSFPAGYSEMHFCQRHCADYTPSSYTNYGEEITLCAPGGDGDYYGTPGVSDDQFAWEGKRKV